MVKDDILHKLMLKKIKIEVREGQAILQIGDKHKQITEMLETGNLLTKVNSWEQIDFKKKSFTYVIADMDCSVLDDFEQFLDKVAPLIIRPGLLIIVASNLCTLKNKLSFLFEAELESFNRPNRAIIPGYLRNRLIEKGYFIKNRYWSYDDKVLIMADIPVNQ